MGCIVCAFLLAVGLIMSMYEASPVLTVLGVFSLIGYSIYFYKTGEKNYINMRDNKIVELKKHIANDKLILWSEFFTLGFLGKEDEIKNIIQEGISKGLFDGELENNDFVSPFIDVISEETLKFLDNLAYSNNLEQYNFVDVTRSSNEGIKNGTYVYKFTDDNDLMLLKAPFNIINVGKGKKYPIFSQEHLSEMYIINKKSIKDFQYFGNQFLETNLSTNDESNIFDTMLSEVLFGSSYTILKGINKMESKHTIRDVRVVQLIFDNQSDIEFSGISIFYDLNRKFGKIKNKELENFETIEKISNTKKTLLPNQSISQELREFKELLNDNIITEDEFNAKKKEILGS